MKRNKYAWITNGVKCKWNDPGINDYPKKDRKNVLNRIFTIVEIKFSEDIHGNLVIDDDTIICIEELDGGTYAEVFPHELKQVKD